MPKHKLKKFERSKEAPNFRITETDLKILQDLADYRFLDTRQLLALHSQVPERTMQRRLQLLYHAKLLERPVQQFSYFQPSNHIIYSLGKKGTKLVFSDRRIENNWTEKNNRIKPFFLLHSMIISNFILCQKHILKTAKPCWFFRSNYFRFSTFRFPFISFYPLKTREKEARASRLGRDARAGSADNKIVMKM
ncbi:MAG: replication-relaxation family protein [Candidatus Pacebacteria bacterium]|nr:replication-relaxation family protein [Candidatus Paceibacterota bacterium]